MLRREFIAAPAMLVTGAEPPTLLILHKGANSLGFYTDSGRLVQEVEVGTHPHEMVVSPDRRYAWVTDNGTMRIEHAGRGGNSVTEIDLRERRVSAKYSLGDFHRPHGIALAGEKLYVTAEAPDRLLEIDLRARKVVRDFATGGTTSHMVTISPDRKYAWVSNTGSDTVAAVDLGTGVTEQVKVGDRPEGSVFTDRTHLCVTNRESNSISIVDTESRRVTGEIATGKGPVRIARTPEGLLVYALLHARAIEVADPRARRIVATIPLPATAGLVSADISTDGKLAYTSAEESDTVYVVSVADRKIVREIKLRAGSHPDPVHPLA